jgi:hypothetical protein
MRTVTFSPTEVRQLLNKSFVCSYENSTGQASSGTSFKHRPRDNAGPCLRGNGRQNVQIYFTTPQGEIFHVLSGYVGPEELEKELRFAVDAYEKLARASSDREQALLAAHTDFLQVQGFSKSDIETGGGGANVAAFGDMMKLFDQAATGRFVAPTDIGDVQQMFDQFGRTQTLSDHRFAMEHPLLSASEFRPEMLVGNGFTFFGSTSFGSFNPGR